MTREEANIWIENTFSDFTKEEDRQESIFYLVKKIFDNKEKKEEVAKEPKEETTDIKPLTFKSIYETDFWGKCYITAMESDKYANTPSFIADIAILELRERIQEDE